MRDNPILLPERMLYKDHDYKHSTEKTVSLRELGAKRN
jgi:hypothetical protein